MTLKIEHTGPVTVLTLDRPEARNAVDAPTALQLAAAIDEFAADDEARILVLTGAGGVAFCAGADLKGVDALMSHPRTLDAGPMGFAALDPGKPAIAAIDGYCFAGGMELAAERKICRSAVDQDDMRQRLGEFARGSRPASPRPLA